MSTAEERRAAVLKEKFVLECYLREKQAGRPYVAECRRVYEALHDRRLRIEAQEKATRALISVLDARAAALARGEIR